MDIIKLTRELGAAIQKDERYLNFEKAKKANEEDAALNELMSQMQLLQMNYQVEASKETPDTEKLQGFEKEFGEIYTQIMSNPNMQAYDEARAQVDAMMNYVMQILGLCVNGADPETCEPQQEAEHSCDGSCGSCGGCH